MTRDEFARLRKALDDHATDTHAIRLALARIALVKARVKGYQEDYPNGD